MKTHSSTSHPSKTKPLPMTRVHVAGHPVGASVEPRKVSAASLTYANELGSFAWFWGASSIPQPGSHPRP